jgi:hypothetical protein
MRIDNACPRDRFNSEPGALPEESLSGIEIIPFAQIKNRDSLDESLVHT